MIDAKTVLECIESQWEINLEHEFESDYLKSLATEYQNTLKKLNKIEDMIIAYSKEN